MCVLSQCWLYLTLIPWRGQSQLLNLERSSSRLTKEASRDGAQLEPSDGLGLLCVPPQQGPRSLSPHL